jgi:drug/metabolite transporter (DMT)-like permease
MSTELIVYVLTGLAGVVVVLTRLRLGGGEIGAGRADVGRTTLNVHTGAGVLALVAWLVFLFGDDRLGEDRSTTLGIVALTLWWIVVIAGLLILVRWLPTHGKHAATDIEDTWSEGPGLSILAHVGMLVGVCVFTYAYLNSIV